MVQSFYDKLFTFEPRRAANEVIDAIPPKITAEMNVELCKAYTNEEIRAALFQMGPTKAPGPDGFPALFYQTHWNFLEEDICHVVRGFLEGRPIPEGFCDSVIVLIPNTSRPKQLKNSVQSASAMFYIRSRLRSWPIA